MLRNNMEKEIRNIASALEGFHYKYEDWTLGDIQVDPASLPAVINLMPVTGTIGIRNGQYRDQADCLFAFVDTAKQPGPDGEPDNVTERMKTAAMKFIGLLNESGKFEQVERDLFYSAVLEEHIPAVSGICVSIRLKETAGVYPSKLTGYV